MNNIDKAIEKEIEKNIGVTEDDTEENEGIVFELLKVLKSQNKRMVSIIYTVLFLWVITLSGTIAGFLYYISLYDFVSYEITSEDGGNANYIGNDGDIYNGENSSTEAH